MSDQLATIPDDAQNIIEYAPGTRQVGIPRIVESLQNFDDATGPTVVIDVVYLVKYRKGDQVLFGAYHAPSNCWCIAL